jgi:hypothetical protein
MNRQQGQQYMSNREELYSVLELSMNRSYEQLRKKRQVEFGNSFVKSFLLECDWKPDELGRENEKNYLCELLSIEPEGKKTKTSIVNICETDETGFYIISWTWNREEITLYLDTISDQNRRFWRAYSISHANSLDEIMNRIIDSKIHIDRIWLWSNLLESIQNNNESKGFRFEHNRSYFQQETNFEPFTLKVSGNQEDSKRLWDLMRSNKELSSLSSLANIRIKYSKPSSQEEFSIETLYYYGKFTTNGTSFSAHQTIVNNIQDEYSNKVYQIERDYIISTTENNCYVDGTPVVFDLSDSRIQDIDFFCDTVFSGKIPFKLWGVPRASPNGQGRDLLAVDLHNGAKIFFEIYPDIICMYLSKGACGNTAIRFYTNLQRNFSQLVEVKDDFGQHLF